MSTTSDLRRLIDLISRSPIVDLDVEQDGWRIRITRNDDSPADSAALRRSPAAVAAPQDRVAQNRPGATAAVAGEAQGIVIASPGFGVFSRAPAPGSPPCVELGDEVAAGQQVGVLEAMKVLTPVTAAHSGRIAEICVADGAEVEDRQPLFRMERP